MAFVPSKAWLLFQIFLLQRFSIIVLADNINETIYINSKPVGVQGYVYCKACENVGIDTLEAATPLAGALVRLACNDKENLDLVQEAKTDKNGYFVMKTEQPLTTRQFQECKVSIVSSPKETCNVPTDLNGGLNGTFLKLSHKIVNTTFNQNKNSVRDFEVFTVGPFAFEAARADTCSFKVSDTWNGYTCDDYCRHYFGCCLCTTYECTI